jgi:hypothetical protein
MVGLIVSLIVAFAVLITVLMWVQGIDYMKENYPDYRGEDLFGEDISTEISNEIHPEEIWNDEKKESLKKFISEHKKNIKKD